MIKFIGFLTPVMFVTLLAGWANATDRFTTIKNVGNGSVEVCRYETDFVQTKDGSNMIRTAWVCTTSKVSK